MATISKITGPSETQLPVSPAVSSNDARADAGSQQETRVFEPPQPQGVNEVLKAQKEKELDPAELQEKDINKLVKNLQNTIDKASKDPYNVGFRMDTRSSSFVIEIKDSEGNLVKQFPPEKVLNLQGKMDDLSGMVIDEMT